MINLNADVFVNGDKLFDNNPEKLKKFANSLRLRVATGVKGVVAGQKLTLQMLSTLVL